MDDEYELMSHESVERLQEQLRKLKKGGSVSSLQASMDELNANIQRLLEVFREASRGVKAEDSKINTLLEQNEKIARAILAVADMVQEKSPEIPRTAPRLTPIEQKPFPSPMPFGQLPPSPFGPSGKSSLPPLSDFDEFPRPPQPPSRGASPSFGMMPPPPSMYPEPEELPPPPGYLPPLPPKKKGLFRR